MKYGFVASMPYVLFKHFGIKVAKSYDRIYGEVEPRGRVIIFGVQGID